MGSSYSTNHVEEHEVITALKETLSAAATDSDACDAVKGAISKLTEQDFEDAIRTGSGLYVDILKESEAAGFGGGLVPMKDMKKAAGKKQQLVNGHLQNIVRRDWKQVAENVIPTEAFGVFLIRLIKRFQAEYDRRDLDQDEVVKLANVCLLSCNRKSIRNYFWPSYKSNKFPEPSDDIGGGLEETITWLLAQSMDNVNRWVADGKDAPGRSISSGNNEVTTLIGTTDRLSRSNETLVNTTHDLTQQVKAKDEKLKEKDQVIEELRGRLSAAELEQNMPPAPIHTPRRQPFAALKRLSPRSKKNNGVGFNVGDRVAIKGDYYKKNLRGTPGKIKSFSTASKVNIEFDDPNVGNDGEATVALKSVQLTNDENQNLIG